MEPPDFNHGEGVSGLTIRDS